MGRPPKLPQYREFETHSLCSSYTDKPISMGNIFSASQPLTIEMGSGKAELSIALARKNSDRNYLAIDIKADRLLKGAKKASELKLKNMHFLKLNLTKLAEALAGQVADEIWITFPDPWPKERSAKHRLTHPNFISQYKKLLLPDGSIKFKTDNLPLFAWSLDLLLQDKEFQVCNLTLDLHQDSPDQDLVTFYEQKFVNKGVKINLLELSYEPNHLDLQRS